MSPASGDCWSPWAVVANDIWLVTLGGGAVGGVCTMGESPRRPGRILSPSASIKSSRRGSSSVRARVARVVGPCGSRLDLSEVERNTERTRPRDTTRALSTPWVRASAGQAQGYIDSPCPPLQPPPFPFARYYSNILIAASALRCFRRSVPCTRNTKQPRNCLLFFIFYFFKIIFYCLG